MLEHDPGIGGRYSVLSNVGLMPAMLAGLDARRCAPARAQSSMRRSAPHAADARRRSAPPRRRLSEQQGIGATVIMPYIDRLALFGLWFRQLWAESLGKDGKGTTPIRAIGPVDQHSQLQLITGGPATRCSHLVTARNAGTVRSSRRRLASDPALDYLAGNASAISSTPSRAPPRER